MEARCDPLSSRKDIDSINMFVHFVMYEHKLEELPLARLPRPMGRWELGFLAAPTDHEGASERRFHKHVEETSMGTMATTQDQRLATADVATTTKKPLWRGLGFQVAVSMVLGIVVGLAWPEFATSMKVLGDIFLRLIKTAVAPLVFLTVAAGIVAAGDVKRVGKVGLISILYFEIVSTVALALGLLFGNLVGVGKGLGHITAPAAATKGAEAAAKAAATSHTSFDQFL